MSTLLESAWLDFACARQCGARGGDSIGRERNRSGVWATAPYPRQSPGRSVLSPRYSDIEPIDFRADNVTRARPSMTDLPRSRLASLARAQIAMALTAADVMQRYAEVTAAYGEGLVRAAATIAEEVVKPEGRGWDRAAAHALAGYRDYVRELAALPGIANMHYYDQLGRLRAARGSETGAQAGAHLPPPTPAPPGDRGTGQ